MITVTPQGSIYLCKTPLENDYKNQLTFTNSSTQEQYFNSKITHTFNNYTYVKKDNIIKVGINIDEIISCNYLFYRNTGFTNKTYYCFITNMEYINENCTAITFETDCFQTWYFQIVYNRCFVEREHVNDDTIGLHTISEDVETGDYIIEKECTTSSEESCYIVVATTFDAVNLITGESTDRIGYRTVNNIPTGLYYYVCPIEQITSYSFLSNLVYTADSKSKADGIVSVFLIPKTLNSVTTWNYLYISSSGWSTDPSAGFGYCPYIAISESTASVLMETISVEKPYTDVNSYVPKNNKLFVYPYKYMVADNNNGNATNYMYEFFSTSPSFKIYGDITPGCSIRCLPENYKNQTLNNLEGLNGGKYPIGSWQSDVYTNWITQNGINVGLDLANSGISMATGIASGNPAGVVSGVTSVINTMSEVYKHSLIPPQVKGNTNCGDVSYSTGLSKFSFYNMSIKKEYAEIIDKYLSIYGYKVNNVKVPNITGRNNWNYVKTINCNIDGEIPQNDLNTIKSMFDNGVTLWHNASTMYDYSQSNGIV